MEHSLFKEVKKALLIKHGVCLCDSLINNILTFSDETVRNLSTN